MRADLQTATQRINLVPGPGDKEAGQGHSRDTLSPGSTIDQVGSLSKGVNEFSR